MTDHIERDAAINAVLGITICNPMVRQYANAVLFNLNKLPAADVRPVVRGRWMTKEYMCGDPEAGFADMWVDRPAEETDYYAYCSVCDKDAEYTGEAELVLSDFCPNCGAEMKEDEG